MNNFQTYLEAKGQSKTTTATLWRQLCDFINWAESEGIESEQCTYNELLGYVRSLQKRGLKQRTVQLYLGSIKHYFNWLITLERRSNNPLINFKVQGITRGKLYHILSKQELESLYENYAPASIASKHENQNWYARSKLVSNRNKMMLGMLIFQGLTTAELQKLEAPDIRLREGKVYIKGGRRSNERLLNLESHQVLDLMEYTLQTRLTLLKESGRPTEKLFIAAGASGKLHNSIQCFIDSLKAQNAKVESARQIRASVITHWLKVHNLRQAQYMAGHRFVSSTEKYLVNDMEGLQEDINKFHPF